MRRLIPIVALSAAACVPATPPPSVAPTAPPPVAAAPPPPALPADWRDWPLTAGTWRYAAATTSARYSDALTLSCDRNARRVRFAPAPAGPVTIRTTSAIRTLPADLALPAADPLLDAMAFSRGHFTVERPGRPPLVIPAHAEVGRVVQDCRD